MMSGNMLGNYQPGSIANILAGLFGNPESPYKGAMNQFQKYFGQATNAQNPFYSAGTNAIGGFQDWLGKMKDPSAFISNLMGQYQQSPYNKFLQDQAMRAGTNAASAQGLVGSTPFAQQMQQNAANISQQGMNDWLSNVLGANTQYGAGMSGLMQGGQHAADILSQLFGGAGGTMAALKFGQKAAGQNQMGQLFGGLLGLFGL